MEDERGIVVRGEETRVLSLPVCTYWGTMSESLRDCEDRRAEEEMEEEEKGGGGLLEGQARNEARHRPGRPGPGS